MKFSIKCSLFFLAYYIVHVQSLDVLRTVLNNGNSFYCVDRWNNCCTTTEWNFIMQKVYLMGANQRRGLRGNETMDISDALTTQESNSTSIDERELQTYPRECARLCEGFLPGRCVANKCIGYRRSLMDSVKSLVTPSSEEERQLYWATSCPNQQSEMNNLLTNIKGSVGQRCRLLLEAPRQFTCVYNAVC